MVSFIHNVPNRETKLKCPSVGEWLEILTHLNHEILLCNKKKQTIFQYLFIIYLFIKLALLALAADGVFNLLCSMQDL